jgi:hypothetical protein
MTASDRQIRPEPFPDFGLLLDTCGIFRVDSPAGRRELPEGQWHAHQWTFGQGRRPRCCILFQPFPDDQGPLWDSRQKPATGEKKGNASVALFTVPGCFRAAP